MTNLKKVLSLALVFAMALGLMISGSAATWTDKDDITNFEDAALLDSLQIMQGNADGTFDPDGILTRAQIAKMIYVARTGGVDDKAVLYKGASNLFTDVAGHWAEGYINFAAAKGFVSGRGNGIFDPDAKITGYELLKIALTALGYDAAKEGFTGANWKLSVAAFAQEAGLTDGYVADPANPVTRDNAANIISNMIFATAVRYVDGAVEKRTKTVLGTTADVSFSEVYLNLVANTGVVTANEYTDSALKGKTTITGTGAGTYSVASGEAELYQEVTIYTKGSSTTRVYGSPVVSSDNKVVTTYAGLTAASKTTSGSLEYWLASNGLSIDPSALPAYITKGIVAGVVTTAFTSTNAGESLKAIDNDGDGFVDYLYRIVKTVAKVQSKTTTGDGAITFDNITGVTFTSKNVIGFSDLAVNDYVLGYEMGGLYYVEKAASVTGKLTGSIASGYVGIIDGAYRGATGLPGYALVDGSVAYAIWTTTAANFNVEKIFYLDNGGNVIRIVSPFVAVTNDKYSFVEATQYTTSFGKASVQVKLINADGTITIKPILSVKDTAGTVVYASTYASQAAVDTALDNKIVTVVENTDGTVSLTLASPTSTITGGTFTKNVATLAAGVYANDATIFVVYNALTGTATVYTGIGNIPSFNSGSVAAEAVKISATNGTAKTVFVTAGVAAATAAKYVYVTGSATMAINALGVATYTYPVIIDGAVTTITDFENGLAEGLYTYTVAANNDYSFSAKIVTDTVDAVSSGLIVVKDAAKAYTITSSTIIYNVYNPDNFMIPATVAAITNADIAVGNEVIVIPNVLAPDQAATIYIFTK